MGQTFVANIHPSFLRVQERKAAMARFMQSADSPQNANTEALTAEVRRLATAVAALTEHRKTAERAQAATAQATANRSIAGRYLIPKCDDDRTPTANWADAGRMGPILAQYKLPKAED